WWDRAGPLQALHSLNRLRVLLWCARPASFAAPRPASPNAELLRRGLLAEGALARLGVRVLGVDPVAESVEGSVQSATTVGPLPSLESLIGRLTFRCQTVSRAGCRPAGRIRLGPKSSSTSTTLAGIFSGRRPNLLRAGGCLVVTTINRTAAFLLARRGRLLRRLLRLVPPGLNDWRLCEGGLADCGLETRLTVAHGAEPADWPLGLDPVDAVDRAGLIATHRKLHGNCPQDTRPGLSSCPDLSAMIDENGDGHHCSDCYRRCCRAGRLPAVWHRPAAAAVPAVPRCPLRTAVRRRRRGAALRSPRFTKATQPHLAALVCCSCCCYFCFTKEDEKVYPSTGLDRRLDLVASKFAAVETEISQRAAEPAGLAYRHQQQAKSQLAPAPPEPQEQRRLLLAAPAPEVTLTFSLTRLSDCLAVHLHSAESTPGPRLGLCHCNFAQAQLVTSSASDYVILETVRTGCGRPDRVPSVQRNSGAAAGGARALMLLLLAASTSTVSVGENRRRGAAAAPGRHWPAVQYDRLPLRLPQTGSCELLVALHYVPSAERLSVMVLKANDIRTDDGSVPGGSAAFKKRSRIFEPSQRPVYNESVGIDLPERRLGPSQPHRVRHELPAQSAPSSAGFGRLPGYVVFSSNCYGSGRAHWDQMVHPAESGAGLLAPVELTLFTRSFLQALRETIS
uniref:C2 domain-containing protein n=1 Tax=Macrostomum lignano TaxID=282301 RepID=A0A1I8FC28_9PLAT